MPQLSPHATGRWRDKPLEWLAAILNRPEQQRPGWFWASLVAGLLLLIGTLDYYTGYEVSVLVFYLLPVVMAVVTMGWMTGVITAMVGAGITLGSDLAAGEHFNDPLTPWWNALIVLVTFLVVIWLLTGLISMQAQLRKMHGELEERVRERTAALTQEITERERLEKAVLEIARRERSSIGQDLHDGLGQYLTGTAIALQMLVDKMEARQTVETADVRKVKVFVERAIEQSRDLAKGLLQAEIEPTGLIAALEELAVTTQQQFKVPCEFRYQNEISFYDDAAPTHLYYIAQEAVRNAVRHGHPKQIEIKLAEEKGRLTLAINDDGIGVSAPAQRGPGLGLRIMAHRAMIIGAEFKIETSPEGGTRIVCQRPSPSPAP